VTANVPNLTDLADEELMSRYVRDDEAAFEVLLARYRRPLFGFLYRYLGRSDKAEDVFQEVFYEIIRARKRYRPEAKFAAWIFRIARNRAVDRIRRDGFRDMESLNDGVNPNDEDGETRLARVTDDRPDPEEMTRGKQVDAALQDALAALPAEQREVFWLKEKSGLTLAEIADLTRVSQNTVKSRLRYALEKLRAKLSERGFGP
jgi:RNA polymerase sigma-70 factor (ECF subfamily)